MIYRSACLILIINAMKLDKKKDQQGLKFIIPKKIGHVVVQQVEEADIFGS